MRFAGSAVDFTAPTTGVTTGGYSGAAGVVDIADSFSAQREKAPKYDEIASMAMQTQSAEKRAAMQAEADVMTTGIQAIGQAKASQMTAEAQMKAADKAAGASKMSSALGAIGSIGGALIGLSDETTKSDVKRIDSALETLRNLRPVTFHYKEEYSSNPERMHHGFIAQEFQKVLPDATYFDDSIGKLAIDTGDIIGLLVRANQELETRIARLEATKALAGVN
tara:strand:- start:1016 stop:1684 length:669 start_codon:yes stop_codon:yes gene_type:complete